MKSKLSVIALQTISVIFLLSGCSQSQSSVLREFSQKILSGNETPSLAVFEEYYGTNAEGETKLLQLICAERSWTPVEKNEQCANFVKERLSNKNNASAYLAWLRAKLPASPKLKILNSVKMSPDEATKYELIDANLNDAYVTFYRNLNQATYASFGKANILRMQNEFAFKIFRDDLEKAETLEIVKSIL